MSTSKHQVRACMRLRTKTGERTRESAIDVGTHTRFRLPHTHTHTHTHSFSLSHTHNAHTHTTHTRAQACVLIASYRLPCVQQQRQHSAIPLHGQAAQHQQSQHALQNPRAANHIYLTYLKQAHSYAACTLNRLSGIYLIDLEPALIYPKESLQNPHAVKQ